MASPEVDCSGWGGCSNCAQCACMAGNATQCINAGTCSIGGSACKKVSNVNDVLRWAAPLIGKNEAFAGMCYLDSVGIPTIGYGLNLNTGSNYLKTVLGFTDAQVAAVKQNQLTISRPQAEQLAVAYLNTAISFMQSYLGSAWQTFPIPVQGVVIDLWYNLGAAGLSKFVNLKNAIMARNWSAASAEIINSKLGQARKALDAQIMAAPHTYCAAGWPYSCVGANKIATKPCAGGGTVYYNPVSLAWGAQGTC
jgi:GH24 family phage-related lysozyme (muramidase)